MGNRHWHTRIDSKTAAFHPNEKSNQFCSTRHDSGHGSSACLNSQNNHPPHGTPSFMAFPTYKLGCDRRCIPMVSMINSTSCQSTLSSTSPWHTADRIDFLFFRSSSYAFGFFRTASNPFTNLLVLCPKIAPCPEAAAQATTAAAANQAADHCKAFPESLRAGF